MAVGKKCSRFMLMEDIELLNSSLQHNWNPHFLVCFFTQSMFQELTKHMNKKLMKLHLGVV